MSQTTVRARLLLFSKNKVFFFKDASILEDINLIIGTAKLIIKQVI